MRRFAAKVDVKTGNGCFVRPSNAYKDVPPPARVDVVLLTTPAALSGRCTSTAAIKADKHRLPPRKPVAVDAPGVRSVLATVRVGEERKKLAVLSGLCLALRQTAFPRER